jgi:ADP-heptose:LPS heptosyltransferase
MMLREDFISQPDIRRHWVRSNADYCKMKSAGDRVQGPRARGISFSPGQKPFPVRSMLILHQGALGDFILALPCFEILRRAFPQARSVFMGYPRILELTKNRFYAEEILSIDQKGMASFFVRGGTLDLRLSRFFETFDVIVVFGKNGEGNLIGNLNRVCEGRVLQINPFPRWDGGVHLIDHLLMELSRYGFSGSERIPRLFLNESDRAWGREYWMGNEVTPEERERAIIVHPGSGSRKKVWPLDRFLKLTEYLRKHLSSKILVVLGPAEGPDVREIFEDEGAGIFILGRGLSLVQLASVMEGCRLFVGNDSGVSHLAAALGIPTLAIFGPTDPRVWSPRGRNVMVIRRGIHCSPCPQERFFQCQHFECLKGVGLEEVCDRIRKWVFENEVARKEVGNGGKEGR